MTPCAGCFWWKRNEETHRFFRLWRELADRSRSLEEVSMFVALWNSPAKALLLQGKWIGKGAENYIRHSAGSTLRGLPEIRKKKSGLIGLIERKTNDRS